jgi:hypothetical protein
MTPANTESSIVTSGGILGGTFGCIHHQTVAVATATAAIPTKTNALRIEQLVSEDKKVECCWTVSSSWDSDRQIIGTLAAHFLCEA